MNESCRRGLVAVTITVWLGFATAPAGAESSPDPHALAARILLMDAYLQALTQPPCRLDPGAAPAGPDAAPTTQDLRRRIERIPREIDAALKAGEESGIPYRETCRGLAAQFRGARERALADYRRASGAGS